MTVAAVSMLLLGMLLGLLGGGAGILTVPMLVYIVGVEPKTAIATSLLCLGVTSLVGTVLQARARRVRWKIGTLFSPAAATGAFAGGRLAHFVPGNMLLSGLGLLLLVAAAAMLKGRRYAGNASPPSLPKMLLLGACVGVLCSLVGAGGGFLVVPALTLFGGLAMSEAVGTSLFIITLQCFAGFLGHASHAELDPSLASAMVGTAVIGVVAGTRLGRKVPGPTLRRLFGWLVFALGLFVLGKLLPWTWCALIACTASIVAGSALILTAPPPSATAQKCIPDFRGPS